DTVNIDDTNGIFEGSAPPRSRAAPGTAILPGAGGAGRSKAGRGDDTVTGGKGKNIPPLARGNDTCVGNPGDGSDVVEGGRGSDTMVFRGAPGAENFTLAASGRHLSLLRNVGNVTMDTHGVEAVDLPALGGSDNIIVNDLSGTDVTNVN